MYLEQAQHEIAKLDPARYSRIISQLQSEVLALQGRPAAFVASPVEAVLGSAALGAAGYKGGEWLYDHVHDLWNKGF
jgi:hypothetical protein